MAKNKLVFEKDEKKSIIIALVISAVVVLAIVLALIAIKKHNVGRTVEPDSTNRIVTTQTTETQTVTEGNAIVVNQEELNKALADTSARAIMIQTEASENIVVPSGDYSSVDLIVDAPYTEVTNYGKFNSVTIKQIASNTWTEGADYNSIVVDSPACHIIVPTGITVSSIQNIQAGATLAIETQGTISELYLMSDGSITSIQVDGTVGMLNINNYTNLSLTGSCSTVVPVSVAYGADTTAISASIPVDVSFAASASFVSETGSEGSKVTIASNTCTVDVSNKTEKDLSVVNGNGKTVKVKAGKDKTFKPTESSNSERTEDSSEKKDSDKSSSKGSGGGSTGSRGTGGGSTGGGSTGGGNSGGGSTGKKDNDGKSDKDLKKEIEDAIEIALNKPYIVGFEEIPSIYAGVEGKIKTKAQIIKLLPTAVKAYASNGDILDISISSNHWSNVDGYNDKSSEGIYKFTAKVSSNGKYYVSPKVMIQAYVFVKSSDKDYTIAFEDSAYKNLIDVKEHRMVNYDNVMQSSVAAYYVLTNNTKSVKKIDLKYSYYTSDGQEILENADRWSGLYIEPGDSWIAERRRPCFDYDYYVVTVELIDPPVVVPKKRNVICTYDFKNSNGRTVNCAISKINPTHTTECSVKVLFFGKLNGEEGVLGMGCFSTGSMNVPSINCEAGISYYTFALPEGAIASSYKIVTLGGYEQ